MFRRAPQFAALILCVTFLVTETSHAHPDTKAAQASTRRDQWLEFKHGHYSVFYQAGYEKDIAFAEMWLNRAEQLMKEKYSVTPDGYRMSVYLHPVPVDTADVNHALNRCCKRDETGVNTGTIDVLTPSAPVWKASSPKSSLGMPKDDESYHAKI